MIRGLDLAISGLTLLIGRNGAGKTTLLRLLAGDLIRAAGDVAFSGAPEGDRPVIGYLPQTLTLPSHLSVKEFVTYAAWLQGQAKFEANERAVEAIEQVDLADRSAHRIGRLSGGMQQRCALAAVLAGNPAVLLLDEPMNALDPIQRDGLIALLSRLSDAMPVMISTHVVDAMAVDANRIVLLDDGRAQFSGNPAALCAPHDLTVEALNRAILERMAMDPTADPGGPA
ncbi:ATP-binding cassette domain-containing protein [Bogoriella caseilytica]|uniref:ATP-binding cassette domain-containing protein n=1 Tax=Bogoriella caseilytica TaxID=56055 RepID=UPI00147614CF|nr:ATP-binding cassette domain-containing protein [Bogoriella caseilytica]